MAKKANDADKKKKEEAPKQEEKKQAAPKAVKEEPKPTKEVASKEEPKTAAPKSEEAPKALKEEKVETAPAPQPKTGRKKREVSKGELEVKRIFGLYIENMDSGDQTAAARHLRNLVKYVVLQKDIKLYDVVFKLFAKNRNKLLATNIAMPALANDMQGRKAVTLYTLMLKIVMAVANKMPVRLDVKVVERQIDKVAANWAATKAK